MRTVVADERETVLQRLYECDLLSLNEVSHLLAVPRAAIRAGLLNCGVRIRTKSELSLLRRMQLMPDEKLGIECRRPWVAALPGELTNSKGYSNRQAVWRFQIAGRHALLKLIMLLKPYIRHAKRRQDMLTVEGHVRQFQ